MGTVKAGEVKEINLAPETEEEDVKQCMAMILNTTKGTVPFMRGFGISGEFFHRLQRGIENDIAADVADQIGKYEERAEMEDIIFDEENEKGYMEYTVPYTLVSDDEDEEGEEDE